MFFSCSVEILQQCSNQPCNTGTQKYLHCFKLHFMVLLYHSFHTAFSVFTQCMSNILFTKIFSLFFFFWKVFATEVNSHRDQIIELDKTGTHLKYFSQKQDVVLIKNLLISVQSRWEKVVQRLVERGRALDDARKRAKQVIGQQLLYNSLNLAEIISRLLKCTVL